MKALEERQTAHHQFHAADALFRTTRALLMLFAVLTAVAFNQLFVLAEYTAAGFSWTIDPPLTAAFLGASYAAGFVLVVLSLRAGAWSKARLPVVTVLIFAVLTLGATLSHLEKFHFDAPGMVARFAAWFWLAIYIAVPVALAGTVHRQYRTAPAASRQRPLPGWLASAVTVEELCCWRSVARSSSVRPGRRHSGAGRSRR